MVYCCVCMCMHVCVCVCMCMHVCVCVCVCLCVYVFVCAHYTFIGFRLIGSSVNRVSHVVGTIWEIIIVQDVQCVVNKGLY